MYKLKAALRILSHTKSSPKKEFLYNKHSLFTSLHTHMLNMLEVELTRSLVT